MFKRVIVATDLSLNSDRLVSRLAGLSDWGTSEIALIHAADFIPREESLTDAGSRIPLQKDRDRRVTQNLDCQAKVLEKQGFTVFPRLVRGRPQEALRSFAKDWRADLLVVSLRRATLAREIILGSTAFEILRRSDVPILLVSPENGVPESTKNMFGHGELWPDNRILFATDFSSTADQAYQLLRNMVRRGPCAVTLLHVLSHGTTEVPGTVRRMEELRRDLAKNGSKVRVTLASGDPAVEILHACEALRPTFLTMGTHGKGAVGEFFVGSVSQAVARRATVPVLLVRHTVKMTACDAMSGMTGTGGSPLND